MRIVEADWPPEPNSFCGMYCVFSNPGGSGGIAGRLPGFGLELLLAVSKLSEHSQKYGIRAMPTFMIFKDGAKVDEPIQFGWKKRLSYM